jgi:hypothetical protein
MADEWETTSGQHAIYGMLGSNYWNGDTSLLFGVEHQAPVNSRCSQETSRYSPSSNNSTSKLCLVPRRGWPQQIEMLPALRENSPSFKHLQEHNSTFWWTAACPWHGRRTTLGLHSSTMLDACLLQLHCAIYSRCRTSGSWRINDIVST